MKQILFLSFLLASTQVFATNAAPRFTLKDILNGGSTNIQISRNVIFDIYMLAQRKKWDERYDSSINVFAAPRPISQNVTLRNQVQQQSQ